MLNALLALPPKWLLSTIIISSANLSVEIFWKRGLYQSPIHATYLSAAFSSTLLFKDMKRWKILCSKTIGIPGYMLPKMCSERRLLIMNFATIIPLQIATFTNASLYLYRPWSNRSMLFYASPISACLHAYYSNHNLTTWRAFSSPITNICFFQDFVNKLWSLLVFSVPNL